LGHNSPRYKQKQTSNVIIWHKKDYIPPVTQKSLEDLISDNEEEARQYALKLYKKFTSGGRKIPNKPDGKPIELHELVNYEAHIEDWQKIQSNNNN